MGSSANGHPTVKDESVAGSKRVVAIKNDGLAELIQSIILERKEEIDEPFYVLDLGVVSSLYSKWTSCLPMIHPYYAVKCNPDPALLDELATLGVNFDCASKAEIEAVLALGVSPDRIIYANPCKSLSHIKYAASVGVNLTTFDAIEELDKIQKWHPKCDLLLRIKPPEDSKAKYPLDSKFRSHPEEVAPLLEAAKTAGLAVVGVSFHIGSEATNFGAFRGAIAAAKMVFNTAARLGITKIHVLDIGGGFTSNPEFHEVALIIKEALHSYFPDLPGLTIISEPGRFFADSAFTIATKIIGKRVRNEHREYWINDGKYGSFTWIPSDQAIAKCTPHPHASDDPNPTCKGLKIYNTTLFGPTCCALDKIFEGHRLPELMVGDWLAFSDMGAYTAACGTSFNGFHTRAIPTYIFRSNSS